MAKKKKASGPVARFDELLAQRPFEGWEDQLLALSREPEVAQKLPERVAGASASVKKSLLDLDDEALLVAVLPSTKGALLDEAVKQAHLRHERDPEGRVLDALARHPPAAKRALETWYSPRLERLRRLADAVLQDKKCKPLAQAAIRFVDGGTAGPEGPARVPFNAYCALERIGATLAPAADDTALWVSRVEWPHASFDFAVPKLAKSVLTFAPDPAEDTPYDFHGSILKLAHLGHDDLGWRYYWERERGAFIRTQDEKTAQFLLFFFDWIGERVEGAEPTDPFVGTWVAEALEYATDEDGYDRTPAKNEAILTLAPDGTCCFQTFSYVRTGGTYTSDGKTVTLTFGPPDGRTYAMTANAGFSRLAWKTRDQEEGVDMTYILGREA